MFTFLVVLTVFVFILLLIVSAQRPVASSVSLFELERRAKHSAAARGVLRREQALPDIRTLIHIKSSILLVVTVVLLIVNFGWALGISFSILVACVYLPLAAWKPFLRLGAMLYNWGEPYYLKLVQKIAPFFAFLRDTHLSNEQRIDSREELQNIIERSGEALTTDERNLIVHALDFGSTLVSSVMTPRENIDHVQKGEFLGPLVLDELHALGHSRLPVVDKDLDHIVGILHMRDMLSLDIKRSSTAEKAMEPKVYYVRQSDTLEYALGVFLKVRHHLLIVVDDESNTTGLLTIEDVIEALIGRKIIVEKDWS